MASSSTVKGKSTYYTVNVNAWVSSSHDTYDTVSWNANINFGDWYLWGVGLNVYVNGALVKNITGATYSPYQQCCSCSGSVNINKTHSSQWVSFSASTYSTIVNGCGGVTSTTTASIRINVGGKTAYTVSYNMNGGSGSIGNQTKWYGENLTLSSAKPTRTGYDFVGWNTNSGATTSQYSSGGTYTSNAKATLYAIWRLKTYTVSYNVNGGTGDINQQTKYYGKALILDSSVPKLSGYKFMGWSKTADGEPLYDAGGIFEENEDVTLYAIWKRAVNCYLKVDGEYVQAMMYIKSDGIYKTGMIEIRDNGAYKSNI